MIQYTKYKKSNNNVVILWNMISTNGVPDRHQYIGLRQAHMLYRIDNNMIGTHQVHLANVGMIPGVNNTQTQYPPHGEKPGINMTQATITAGFFFF